MIYLVTKQTELFDSDLYKIISVEESLFELNKLNVISVDTETTGRDAHINKLLCVQIGNKDNQYVIDCSTIDIKLYKDLLESKFCIFQNGKFDLQFFFSVGIIIRRLWDTMIVEQLLYLGYPSGVISYSLAAIAQRRLHKYIDKSVRGEIIWRGLDDRVIEYSANDVVDLQDIMNSQIRDCQAKSCFEGAKLECLAVPSIAYCEWCGIKLDENKWKLKMEQDQLGLEEAKKALDEFCINNPKLSKFTIIDRQGDLFEGFDLTPKCSINWSSSRQVVEVAKILGFDTTVQDKKTGEDKDSVLEKYLKSQKGINDEFIKLYFNYQEKAKVCSTYGQAQLNMINPITGRCHTVYRQLGASSGRMSCGSQQPNTDLAKLKGISAKECTYCNFQQLPADDATRGAFVAEPNNVLCDCDYSALESYLAADIYNDKAFQDEFLYGSKDTHNLFAWIVFNEECRKLGCKDATEVKEKAPKWRKAVKAVEFAFLFGASAPTIAQSAGCSVQQAEEYVKRLEEGFTGITRFAKEGSKFVRTHGYVLMNKYTGHKMYWWDFDKWKQRQATFTSDFWDDYRINHKGTGDAVALEVREHFQAASKWDRMARNAVTQGTGCNILKTASTRFLNWIVDNGYFNIVKICAMVHDELLIEYPKDHPEICGILENIMETASTEYCKFSKIPAKGEVGDHWIH